MPWLTSTYLVAGDAGATGNTGILCNTVLTGRLLTYRGLPAQACHSRLQSLQALGFWLNRRTELQVRHTSNLWRPRMGPITTNHQSASTRKTHMTLLPLPAVHMDLFPGLVAKRMANPGASVLLTFWVQVPTRTTLLVLPH